MRLRDEPCSSFVMFPLSLVVSYAAVFGMSRKAPPKVTAVHIRPFLSRNWPITASVPFSRTRSQMNMRISGLWRGTPANLQVFHILHETWHIIRKQRCDRKNLAFKCNYLPWLSHWAKIAMELWWRWRPHLFQCSQIIRRFQVAWGHILSQKGEGPSANHDSSGTASWSL